MFIHIVMCSGPWSIYGTLSCLSPFIWFLLFAWFLCLNRWISDIQNALSSKYGRTKSEDKNQGFASWFLFWFSLFSFFLFFPLFFGHKVFIASRGGVGWRRSLRHLWMAFKQVSEWNLRDSGGHNCLDSPGYQELCLLVLFLTKVFCSQSLS